MNADINTHKYSHNINMIIWLTDFAWRGFLLLIPIVMCPF